MTTPSTADHRKKHISPTVWYLFAALTACAGAWWWVFSLFTPLQSGRYWSGAVFAWVHLAILGGLLTGAFGVMFQLVPIAFQAPPVPRRMALWHLPLHLLSVTLMIIGFLRMEFGLVGIGGSVLLVCSLLFLFTIYKSYRQARNKTVVHQRFWIPVAGLLLVMSIGVWQALGLPGTGAPLLFSHIVMGSLWFWGGLILVISYKFIPMFVLSHGYYANLKLSSALYFFGTALTAVSSYWPFANAPLPSLLGSVFVIGGIATMLQDVQRIVKARKRKRIVFPLKIAIAATLTLSFSMVLLLAAIDFHSLPLGIDAGYLFLFAGMVPLLAGYAQKMVPFLYYEYRYSHAPDRKSAPLIDEMVPRVPVRLATILYTGSVITGLVYFLTDLKISPSIRLIINLILSFSGATAFVFLLASFISVLRIGGKRPDDTSE